MSLTSIPNSTFLDAFAYNQASAAQFAAMADESSAKKTLEELFASSPPSTPNTEPQGLATVDKAAPGSTITVALVLDRQTDPTNLLHGSWASRQATLGEAPAQVFAQYGAASGTDDTPGTWDYVLKQVKDAVGSDDPFNTASDAGNLSSAQDRTIWLTLSRSEFKDLFGTDLLSVTYIDPSTGKSTSCYAWAGDLSLPSTIASTVSGLWIDQNVVPTNPYVFYQTPQQGLTAGPLGIGNAAPGSANADAWPAAVAAHYGFPLPAGTATDPIALVEENVPQQQQLFAAYNQYRVAAGLQPVTQSQFQIVSGPQGTGTPTSELTLDISVIAGGAPNSTQLIFSNLDQGTTFTAYQQAFFNWMLPNGTTPAVLSSSRSFLSQASPDSPFQWAWQQLFVDGALSDVSVHLSAGDQGSSANLPNGAANVPNSQSPAFALVVGGTSVATLPTAQADPTLIANIVTPALQDDPGTVFGLVAAGLTVLPSSLSDAALADPTSVLASFVEAVWQGLSLTDVNSVLQSPYGDNQTGVGGIQTALPIPLYQSEFGLDALLGGSRGSPDVSALSAGDARYVVLNNDYLQSPSNGLTTNSGGTSAAAPLWATLTTQFNKIFSDQGLPQLGFYNDLLYTAAAVAPASFNDILLSNNINGFYYTAADSGFQNTNPKTPMNMVPTGQGYSAGPGYDLASGLGTPNGLLLARSLTAIAQAQMFFPNVSDVVTQTTGGGWQSGARQSLLVQTTLPNGSGTVSVTGGARSLNFGSGASGQLAWTSRLAGQVEQSYFDDDLVRLFDMQEQGTLAQLDVAAGDALSIAINGVAASGVAPLLTSPYGFADFETSAGTVRLARAVAVAETAGGAPEADAIVRVRQDGSDNLSVSFYRVDDFAGTIDNSHPGDAGYASAAAARAYQLQSGGTSLGGPGFGNYEQTMLEDVHAGDIIAMELVNNTHGNVYWAFAQGNEQVDGQNVGHLWNYAMNTWGWEDTFGGGDRDYNDLVVQLDFTSNAGSGWIK
jgi:hypothetical protein